MAACTVMFRAGLVYAGYLVYYCLFWVCLSRVLKSTEEYTHVKVIFPAIVFTTLLAVFQIVQLKKIHQGDNRIHEVITNSKSLFHLPTFVFILFSIGPFGVSLHHGYLAAATDSQGHAVLSFIENVNQSFVDNTLLATKHNCFDLRLKNFEFFVLQSIFPLIIFSQMIFPFPSQSYTFGQMCALALKLVESFDIMDLISDAGCVQNNAAFFQFIFYLAVSVAPLLLSVPAGLEDLVDVIMIKGENEGGNSEERRFVTWFRTAKSVLMVIFVDVLFFVLRITLMLEEVTNQNGYGFLWKEFFSAIFRTMFVYCALKKIHRNNNITK